MILFIELKKKKNYFYYNDQLLIFILYKLVVKFMMLKCESSLKLTGKICTIRLPCSLGVYEIRELIICSPMAIENRV